MTSAEVLQAPRSRAGGEDGGELHGGASGPAGGLRRRQAERGPQAHRSPTTRSATGPAAAGRSGSTCSTSRARRTRRHPEVVRWLQEEHGTDGWSAQSITVSYERARGGRAVGREGRRPVLDHGVEDGGRAGRAAVRCVRGRVAALFVAALTAQLSERTSEQAPRRALRLGRRLHPRGRGLRVQGRRPRARSAWPTRSCPTPRRPTG